MPRGTQEKLHVSPHEIPSCVVPSGAPDWVTSELLAKTIAVWQPYYADPLTVDDALGMILDVGNLMDVLSKGRHREAIRRTGSGQQSGTGT